jgi:hypothetical protein
MAVPRERSEQGHLSGGAAGAKAAASLPHSKGMVYDLVSRLLERMPGVLVAG